ncbi:hypothetical protein WMY93_034377 [Mugilogobius chulae]|uniref:Uncharacterized protein n=1 Tax=Mugilogobius chulae TaxID=88201 RepID=A0AAW0MJB1_9GOBI
MRSLETRPDRTRSARRGTDPEREGMRSLETRPDRTGAHGEERTRSVQEYRLKHGQTGPGARGENANRLEMDTTTGRQLKRVMVCAPDELASTVTRPEPNPDGLG